MWLEIMIAEQTNYPLSCDGCGQKLTEGTRYLSGISSCCGGGCERVLCEICVQQSSQAFIDHHVGAIKDGAKELGL
jgi:hypothetical protein